MAADIFVELQAVTGEFLAKLGGAETAIDRLGKKATGMQKLATVGKAAFLGIAGGAIVLGAASIKAAATFESSMELLRTQAGASQGEVNAMSKAVLALAGQTATAPDELAAGLYHLESAGLRGKKALDALRVAAEGAKVGHADLESVTNALNAVLASGIPGAQNFSQAMGALNATVGAGDMRMQDLADAMGTGFLATVKGFGVTLRDAGAALATFGDNNIRGADAATQLRMAVLFMAQGTKNADAVLGKIGLSTEKLRSDLASGGLNKALTDLHSHLTAAGDTGAKMGDVLLQAFGHKAGTGLSVLVGQFGRFQSKYKEVQAGAQGFGSDWTATTKTFSFQMQKLQATGEALATSIGMKLIPVVERVLTWINNGVEWLDKHRLAVIALAGAVGGPLVVAMGAAVVAMFGAEGAIGSLSLSLGALEVTGAPVIAVVLAIVAVCALLAVGVYELYKHWSTVWKAIKTAAKDVADFVVRYVWHDGIEKAFNGIKAVITTTWKVLWNTVFVPWRIAFAVLEPIVLALWHNVVEPAFHGIGNVVRSVWTGLIKPTWDLLKGGLSDIGTAVSWLVNTFWDPMWDSIQTAVQGVWAIIKPIFDAIEDSVGKVTGGISKVVSIAGKVGGGISHLIPHFASGTWNAPGGMALVGENGPELLNLPRGAGVSNAQATRAALGGGGGDTYVTVQNIVDGRVVSQTVQKADRRYQQRNGRNTWGGASAPRLA